MQTSSKISSGRPADSTGRRPRRFSSHSRTVAVSQSRASRIRRISSASSSRSASWEMVWSVTIWSLRSVVAAASARSRARCSASSSRRSSSSVRLRSVMSISVPIIRTGRPNSSRKVVARAATHRGSSPGSDRRRYSISCSAASVLLSARVIASSTRARSRGSTRVMKLPKVIGPST